MVRNIAGVVVGYISIALTIFISFTLLYLVLGTEGSFEEESYDVSTIWIIISFILGLAAAILGGYLCGLISKNFNAVIFLAGFVLVLGMAMAIFSIDAANQEVQELRKGEVAVFDAMQKAMQPAFIMLLNPMIGAMGVSMGGKIWKKKFKE